MSTLTALTTDEELDNYFSAPLTYPSIGSSSPIQHHLSIIEEELQKPFPSNPTTLAKLERSLLKVAESEDAEMPALLQQACIEIALYLSKVVLNHKMYKARCDSSMKDLEELASLKPKRVVS